MLKFMWEYHIRRTQALITWKLIIGKRLKSIVDWTMLELAKLSRARTQRIRRASAKAFFGQKKKEMFIP